MIGDRTIWRTVKIRAGDIEVDDVTRNKFGKWATVRKTEHSVNKPHIEIHFDSGDAIQVRKVHLVDLQVPKPS